jgi:hypothetical protein
MSSSPFDDQDDGDEYPGPGGRVYDEDNGSPNDFFGYPAEGGREDCCRPTARRPSVVLLGDDDKRGKELHEQQVSRHEREQEKLDHRWPRLRVVRLERWLKFLNDCRRRPAAERSQNLKGWVYLLWCPTLGLHKIGWTEDIGQRLKDLRQKLDRQLECRVDYRTPVDLELLEEMLHRHFYYRHRPSDKSDELFDLSPEEANGFEATVKRVERSLLDIDILRLEGLLAALEEECRQAATGRRGSDPGRRKAGPWNKGPLPC